MRLPDPADLLADWSCCAICARWPRAAFCAECVAAHAAVRPRCIACGIGLAVAVDQPDRRCGGCVTTDTPIDRAVAAVDYGYPWDAVIARFKFGGEVELARPLAGLLGAALDRSAALTGARPPDLLVPAPLTPQRLRERGYNQAWELARRLGRRRRVPARADLLDRVLGGPHQAELPREQRLRQVRGAYAPTPAGMALLRGQRVALVDDVMTTGATAREIARTLRAAGAASVQVWVLARTPES